MSDISGHYVPAQCLLSRAALTLRRDQKKCRQEDKEAMKREHKDERLKQTKGKEEFIKIGGKNLILVASSTTEQVRKCRHNVTIPPC